ncbi:hypothetical protein BSL78_21197 [Apostichopus japonicus]|uniref:Uncharacterized protein n=1 Tax=Stichopus japonicus TaxID=307972 RepID=A0A2G8K1R4_STIJA|nr:hypothetical protein BSL78_21197 [Apostichopus japonicus]
MSAIAAIHSGFRDVSSVCTLPQLLALPWGMANRRPPRHKLLPAWSINGFLNYQVRPTLKPMDTCPIKELNIKTLLLVAAGWQEEVLSTRLSTAEWHIRFDKQNVRLVPDPMFFAKNLTLAVIPENICLPKLSLSSDPRRVSYLYNTKGQKRSQALFVLPTIPHSTAQRHARQVVGAGDPAPREGGSTGPGPRYQ